MRHTHNRSQRFGGHTKHSWECVCGRVVRGNGGKQHFKLDGHRRLTRQEQEARLAERIAESAATCPECGGYDPGLSRSELPEGARYCTPLSCSAWTFTHRLTKQGAKPIRSDGRADLSVAPAEVPQ